MKVIYNDETNDSLTYDKEYEVIEVYVNTDINETAFRIIDDNNKPLVYESNLFDYECVELDNMVLCELDFLFVFTLKKIYKALNGNIDVNEFWEYYLESGYFKEVVQEVIDDVKGK